MWTRFELKTKAKNALKGSYWHAFLVSIVIALFDGGVPQFNLNLNGRNGTIHHGLSQSFHEVVPYMKYILGFITIAVLIGLIIGILLRLFLAYPLLVGGRKYFVNAAQGDKSLSYLGAGFHQKSFLNLVKTMFFRDLFTFLWSLLLIIPGIIKSYGYSMAPYILADNPNLPYEKVLGLSQEMTSGHKFSMFILDLSFLGWYLLGTLALLVGVFFVFPYVNATKAELYLSLRENAIHQGMTSYEELNLTPVVLAE